MATSRWKSQPGAEKAWLCPAAIQSCDPGDSGKRREGLGRPGFAGLRQCGGLLKRGYCKQTKDAAPLEVVVVGIH
eukprot:239203-Pelagomonas_calceolata.AAC.1